MTAFYIQIASSSKWNIKSVFQGKKQRDFKSEQQNGCVINSLNTLDFFDMNQCRNPYNLADLFLT